MSGWGAAMGDVSTGGHWSIDEIKHINVLETKAILFGLKALCQDMYGTPIRIRTDYATALSCVHKCGSNKIDLLNITEEIFQWAIDHSCPLSVSYIKGTDNVEADRESRAFNLDTEWMLDGQVFQHLCEVFGQPEIDFFASRINNQLPRYVSWRRDPGAIETDAFTCSWENIFIYAFPPLA